jgi:tetratricopeptide (TPR) repeat protein
MVTVDEICQSDVYKRMVEAIAAGAIAYIGAGTSIPLGYPAWGKLLDIIGEEAERCSPGHPELPAAKTNDDVLVRAQVYSDVLGNDRLGRLVANIFGPKAVQFNDLHKSLIATPFLHFLTTNYEDSLESAQAARTGNNFHRFDFDETAKRSTFLRALGYRAKVRCFVHLHGSIHRPEHIILTLNHYRTRYTNVNDVRAGLQIIHSQHSLVFIGYGLADHFVMHDLDVFTGLDGGTQPRHFAITALPSAGTEAAIRQKFERRYGITPLFYDPHDRHEDLPILIERLQQDSTARKNEIEAENAREFLAKIFGNDNRPLTLDEAMSRVPRIMAPEITSGISIPPGTTDSDERVPLDEEIDAIAKQIKEGNPSVAIALFTNLINRPPIQLSGRLRYRLHANRANAYLTKGELGRAADEYLIAGSFWRSKDSRALEALAYSLKGDTTRAIEISNAMLAEDQSFPRAHSIRLRSLPKGTTVLEAKRSVPRKLRRNPEIAIALGGIAGDAAQYRIQEAYARTALADSPDWGEAWISLGAAILLTEKARADIDIEVGLIPRDRARIQEAEHAFTTALKFLSGEVSPQHQRTAYFNRATVRQMLGEIAGAKDDLHRAYALGPNESEIVARMAMQLGEEDELQGAIQVLERYPQTESQPNTAFVLALTLFRRNGTGDLDRAADILRKIIENHGSADATVLVTEAIELLSAIYVTRKNRAAAITLFESLPGLPLSSGLRNAHLARLLWEGDEEEKKRSGELIAKAAQEALASGDWFTRRQVGYFAAQMNLPALAFGLLRSITAPTRYNLDTTNVLRCARASGEDAFILDFGTKLRSNGFFQREAISLEIETLLRCNEVEPAIDLLKDWLTREPGDKEMRLNLSTVGLHRDEPSLIETDPAKLPSPDEVSDPARGAAVVAVMRIGPDPAAAIHYAYALWRRFSDDMVAQRLLIETVLQARSGRTALTTPKTVDAMSAVTYREAGISENRTVVIEEGKNPRATLSELPRNNELVKALWGQHVSINVNDDAVKSGRRYQVLTIQNKIVYRAKLCLQDFQPAFGAGGGIEQYTIPANIPPGTDPKVALGDMWKVLSDQDQLRQHLVGLYQEANLPVSALAQTLGRSVFETMMQLTGTPELGILTALSDDKEWNNALEILKGVREVVLDDSAIATLFLLDLQHHIPKLPIRLIVPDSAVQELRNFVRRQTSPGETAGYIAVRNEQLILREEDVEQKAAWLRRLREFIQSLVTHCEIVGGKARLDLPPAVRQQLPETFGYALTDAVAIAKARNLPLWTDDLYTAALICVPLGIRRVWVQPVIRAVEVKDPSGSVRSDVIAAKLFQLGYNFTRLSGEAILDIFDANAWDDGTRSVDQILKFIAIVGALNVPNLRITMSLIVEIWFRCRNGAKAMRLIERILDGIGRPIAGPAIARPIYRSPCPPQINARKWKSLRRWLRKWRSRANG